jgi:regulator of replication initiation timing
MKKSYTAELRDILGLATRATLSDIVYHTNCLKKDMLSTHNRNIDLSLENRKLREALEKGPHMPWCLVHEGARCNCWKDAALSTTEGAK